MLLIREEHAVRGEAEDEFDATVRDEWLPALGKTDEARLLYYTRLAHGSGEAYQIITYTLVRDGSCWERFMHNVHSGGLQTLSGKLDGLRHSVTGKILVPLPWSKLQNIDLDSVPTQAGEHELSLFMEDTVHPRAGLLDEYIQKSGEQYAGDHGPSSSNAPRLLEIEAGFRTAHGTSRRSEIVLWQRVLLYDGLLRLLKSEIPDKYKKPGKWMVDALTLRDQWRSRLLRTVSWSPWF